MSCMTDETHDFEAFYTHYRPLVLHVLSSLRGSHREYIEDLTQETFLKAWKAYDRIDQTQNAAGWIVRIAQNVQRDFLRHMQACHRLDAAMEDEEGKAFDLPDPHPEGQAVYSGEVDAVARAFQYLRAEDQRVMALLFQEYTPPEIAAVLHLDREACRARIQRARRRFQRLYLEA